MCLALCKVFDSVPPHDMIVRATERRGLDGWSQVWLKQMRCSGALQQPGGVFVLARCWPKAGSAFAEGLLQDAAWAGAIEKREGGCLEQGLEKVLGGDGFPLAQRVVAVLERGEAVASVLS